MAKTPKNTTTVITSKKGSSGKKGVLSDNSKAKYANARIRGAAIQAITGTSPADEFVEYCKKHGLPVTAFMADTVRAVKAVIIGAGGGYDAAIHYLDQQRSGHEFGNRLRDDLQRLSKSDKKPSLEDVVLGADDGKSYDFEITHGDLKALDLLRSCIVPHTTKGRYQAAQKLKAKETGATAAASVISQKKKDAEESSEDEEDEEE